MSADAALAEQVMAADRQHRNHQIETSEKRVCSISRWYFEQVISCHECDALLRQMDCGEGMESIT